MTNKIIVLFSLVFITLILSQSAQAAWSDPTAPAPGGNPPPPLYSQGDNEISVGTLSIGTGGPATLGSVFDIFGTALMTDLGVANNGTFGGSLGIGLKPGDSPTETLEVGGNIKADTDMIIGGQLHLPTGASDGNVLVTDSSGNANWQDPNNALNGKSDLRLKDRIAPLLNSLAKITSLNGVSFFWKDAKKFDDKQHIGVIAQDVEKVFPELVATDKDGIKSVDYAKLTAPIIESIKELNNELKTQNTELRAKNAELEARLAKIEAKLR